MSLHYSVSLFLEHHDCLRIEPVENLLGERLRGSFEMEIRLSDVKKSEPDYIIKGKSSDTLKGQGDVTVQNKSGEVLMTMTREATKKMIQSSFESANISMATNQRRI